MNVLSEALTTFIGVFAISFVALVVLFKVCIGKVMKLLGADFYAFNMKKRLKIISIISLVFAVIGVFCVLLG